jgi:hypothetical protein
VCPTTGAKTASFDRHLIGFPDGERIIRGIELGRKTPGWYFNLKNPKTLISTQVVRDYCPRGERCRSGKYWSKVMPSIPDIVFAELASTVKSVSSFSSLRVTKEKLLACSPKACP